MSLVQFLVTLQIGLGVIRWRLGASEIRFCLARAGLRHVLLRFRFGKLALGRFKVSNGAGQVDFVVARVQFDQQIATLDLIVIVKMDRFDVRRNLWADLDDVRFDSRVVGRFITGVVNKPESSAGQDECTNGAQDEETTTWPLRLSTSRAGTADLANCGRPIAISGFGVSE